ncbi:hypothetical protein [Amnibacterium kyonggiense]|uniref:Uncharacterized protein n=1 Tax=Amnibacterium kyonggiense TaxID=595671 RepID=A0A4R7FTA6_9MICO|nr:hypothetical protein [Amnibacterium kyonggiense]TDS81113.1 hypothetical protein CLV52_1689 [Amnibacterium kyonggiense]
MTAGTRAPDWYRIDGKKIFWDGQQWLDQSGRVVSGPDAEPDSAPAAFVTRGPERPRGVPAWPFVLGVLSLVIGIVMLALPAGQQQADNLDLVGAAHVVFMQYIGGILLAVNGFVWLAAGAVIAYVRPSTAR